MGRGPSPERTEDGWILFDSAESKLGLFDWVIFTAPAAQTATLCPEASSVYQASKAARMQGCFALMLGFEHKVESISLDKQDVPHAWYRSKP